MRHATSDLGSPFGLAYITSSRELARTPEYRRFVSRQRRNRRAGMRLAETWDTFPTHHDFESGWPAYLPTIAYVVLLVDADGGIDPRSAYEVESASAIGTRVFMLDLYEAPAWKLAS
jgi:hypothetical protein